MQCWQRSFFPAVGEHHICKIGFSFWHQASSLKYAQEAATSAVQDSMSLINHGCMREVSFRRRVDFRDSLDVWQDLDAVASLQET